MNKSTLGQKLREIRQGAGFSLRKAAVAIDIDVAILSKMERGERKLNKDLVLKLADLYQTNADNLVIEFLSEKVLFNLRDEEYGVEALKVAEMKLKYQNNNKK
jgi:HTH-type transcriptional regulator, competence development regulator